MALNNPASPEKSLAILKHVYVSLPSRNVRRPFFRYDFPFRRFSCCDLSAEFGITNYHPHFSHGTNPLAVGANRLNSAARSEQTRSTGQVHWSWEWTAPQRPLLRRIPSISKMPRQGGSSRNRERAVLAHVIHLRCLLSCGPHFTDRLAGLLFRVLPAPACPAQTALARYWEDWWRSASPVLPCLISVLISKGKTCRLICAE